MSATSRRAPDPEAHNYVTKLMQLHQAGLLPRTPGAYVLAVYHDGWCKIYHGGACNCAPDLVVESLPDGSVEAP